MPSTINGVGTTYYGKKNLRRHTGVCESCKHEVEMLDYETRLWFTVAFIPLIPLGRKQVLNYCTACTGHMAVPVEQWNQITNEMAAESAREAAKNPTDTEAAIEQLFTLMSLDKRDQATRYAGELTRRFPDSAEVQMAVGTWWGLAGEDDKADAAFAKALALTPDNLDARRAVGTGAIEQGDLVRARELLRFMEQPGEKQDLVVLAQLACAYQAAHMHDQAVDIFRIMLRSQASLRGDKRFRKMVYESQKALPMQEPVLPTQTFWQTRRFKWAAVLAVLAAAAFAADHFWAAEQTVHVINGLSAGVQVRIDGGEAIAVPPGGRVETRVPRGAHRAEMSGPNGMKDAVDFSIDSTFLLGMFDDSVRVLNAFGSGVVLWQKAGYATSAKRAGEPETKWYVGQSYFTLDEPDYLFTKMPEKVDLESSSSVAYRTGVSVFWAESSAGTLSAAEVIRMAPGDNMRRFAEAHLRAKPQDADLLRVYVAVCDRHNLLKECRAFLAAGLGRRPVLVEWHRVYQHACRRAGQWRDLPAEYDRMLQADSGNSNLLYLVGRLQQGAAKAGPYLDRAIQADPKNPYPYVSKAFRKLAVGQFAEAEKLVDKARQCPGDMRLVESLRDHVYMATKNYRARERKARSDLKKSASDMSAHQALLSILIAQGHQIAAEQAQQRYERHIRGRDPSDSWQAGLRSEAHLRRMTGEHKRLAALAGKIKDPLTAGIMRVSAALEAGDLTRADQFAPKLPAPTWRTRLLLAVAAHGTDPAQARKWREGAAAELVNLGPDEERAAQLLRAAGSADADAARDLSMLPSEKIPVLVALVQAGADKSLLDLAEKLNFTPGTTQRVAARAIKRLRR